MPAVHDPEKACPGLDPGWAPVFGRDRAPPEGMATGRIRPRRIRPWRLRLLFELADAVHPGHPVARRTPPDLPLRHQLIALFQHADAHDVDRLLTFARRGRIQRGAAGRAERLRARIAALGRGLDVDRRLAAYLEAFALDRDSDAERRTAGRLAVGAMADAVGVGIRLALDRDTA